MAPRYLEKLLSRVQEHTFWNRATIILFLFGIVTIGFPYLLRRKDGMGNLPTLWIKNTYSGVSNSNCPTYEQAIHPEENDFSLAYSIMVYTDLSRAVRLISAIYRPHNYYCVHIDKKTSSNYSVALQRAIKDRGMKVFFVPDEQRLDVRWGTMTNLEPDLICAQHALRSHGKWKYWINLTGHEFPLLTNWELVTALRAFNGTNLVGRIYKRRNLERLPPDDFLNFNITWYKGSVHVAVRREFVDYMLNNERAKAVLSALRRHEHNSNHGIHPDESFFSTLNHNPSALPIPGAVLHMPEQYVNGFITRAKIWVASGYQCEDDRWLRSICIFGIKDLPLLLKQPHFFANKFLPHAEPMAYDVLESWLATKVAYENQEGALYPSFNLKYYENLSSYWPHL